MLCNFCVFICTYGKCIVLVKWPFSSVECLIAFGANIYTVDYVVVVITLSIIFLLRIRELHCFYCINCLCFSGRIFDHIATYVIYFNFI